MKEFIITSEKLILVKKEALLKIISSASLIFVYNCIYPIAFSNLDKYWIG